MIKNKIVNILRLFFTFLFSPLKERYVLKPILFMTMSLGVISIVTYEILIYHSRGLQALIWLIFLSLGILLGGFYLLSLLMKLLKKIPVSTWFFLGPVFYGFYVLFASNRSPIGSYIALVATIYLMFFISYLLIGIFTLIKAKRFIAISKIHKVIIHGLGLMAFICVYYVFFTGGFKGELYENAFDTYKSEVEIREVTEQYQVIKGVYGSDDYIKEFGDENSEKSFSTNIGYFLGGFGQSKEDYLGFNTRNVPLNAHYYVPDGQGPFPVVLVVHGNHEMVDRSEVGYEYLGEYLAKRGYAVFSVDENFLNYSMYNSEVKDDKTLGENDARAFILLEHIRFLEGAKTTSKNALFNNLDLDSIALMGHSRGGEAVAIAEFFNHVKYLPSNSKKKLSRNYDIKSIVAIAPTDGQYKPGNRPTEMKNVNYLLLHGTHDMDVTYLAGNNQYERVNFSETDYYKSQVLIYGANHGQFNSSWSRGDSNPIANNLHNTGQLIQREDQEAIASQLICYFLESTLKDNNEYRQGFKNLQAFVDLPETLYLSQYHGSEDLVIVDYSEDNYIQTTTIGKGVIYQNGLSSLREGVSNLDGRSSQIFGAYLYTTEARVGRYTIDFYNDSLDASPYKKLFLTLSDETKNSKSSYDFDIELIDVKGSSARISLSDYGQLQHKLNIKLSKFEIFDNQLRDESMFQTFELAFENFEYDEFDWNQIKKISLILPEGESRKIFMKDLGIR
jgi:dienelactone hydrolase